jgi:ribosomal protein S18 acetylase RimI-like enzyme
MSTMRSGPAAVPARAAGAAWRLRPAGPADFAAIAEIRNACRRAEGKPAADDEASVAAAWEEPGCDLARDGVVAELADGTVVGYDEAFDRGSRVVFDCWGADVLPEARGRGIEDALLAWVERRTAERARRLPPGTEVRLQTTKPDPAPGPVREALERAGFRPLHGFLMMRAPLRDAPAAARWPAGIVVETLRPGGSAQERELWQARTDSFADHWGAKPPDPVLALARFRHEVSQPDFDRSLMWAARAGSGEVAGICFCRGSFRGDESVAYVAHLGVVPAWRKRGLARALLRHAMAGLRERGRTAAVLGVDADHPTGAVGLYRSEGFRETGRTAAWGKLLRAGGPEEAGGPEAAAGEAAPGAAADVPAPMDSPAVTGKGEAT